MLRELEQLFKNLFARATHKDTSTLLPRSGYLAATTTKSLDMSTRTTISPTESELTRAIASIKAANPQMGIAKVHVLLLSTYPGWLVSEKRTRKVLQGLGLIVSSGASSSVGAGSNSATASPVNASGDGDATTTNLDPPEPSIFPSSRVIETLDTHQWTPKVQVRYFDEKKGKGLIALYPIAEGEIIWREDPFIVAPEW